MLNNHKAIKGILIIAVISIFVMYVVDGIINPGYLPKSFIKIIMFLIFPIVYTFFDKSIILKDIFIIQRKNNLFFSIIIGIGIFVLIIGAYFIMNNFIDLENIKELLEKNVRVNKDNFIWVALYISFINSLLEEFFFRGFLFLNLKKISKRKFAHSISAFFFAIYHVSIMSNWFTPSLFIISMIGLFVGGLIFNYLNEKNENIYGSWIVHMMANFSINTIGFIMFGII